MRCLDCTADAVDGTGWCRNHLAIRRAQAVADMEADYDGDVIEDAVTAISEAEREALGQRVLTFVALDGAA